MFYFASEEDNASTNVEEQNGSTNLQFRGYTVF